MDQRQYLEAAARCISIMVYYHNTERAERSEELMASEIRDVAGMIAGATQPDEDPYRVHIPVEEGLIARYGPEAGTRLFAAFADAYEGSPSFVPLYPEPESVRRGRSLRGRASSVGPIEVR